MSSVILEPLIQNEEVISNDHMRKFQMFHDDLQASKADLQELKKKVFTLRSEPTVKLEIIKQIRDLEGQTNELSLKIASQKPDQIDWRAFTTLVARLKENIHKTEGAIKENQEKQKVQKSFTIPKTEESDFFKDTKEIIMENEIDHAQVEAW